MPELAVAALFGDPPVVEHHDLVDLVEPVAFVGDEQDGAALRPDGVPAYLIWTEGGLLRAVSYQGQREDKGARQVVSSLIR